MFKWLGKLFGGGDKGIIEQASDVVDKWIPSETTKHKMNIEDQTAGDSSQDSARKMEQKSHDTWFDVLVDGFARLPRPVITGWVIGILFGWVPEPTHLTMLDPLTLNIIWTVITFWFGSRVVFKDIPAMVYKIRNMK